MFYIRLSETFKSTDVLEDIRLAEVPAVGDTIEIDLGNGNDVDTYNIRARRFLINFHKGEQIDVEEPRVLLHVEKVKPSKPMNWSAV